VDERIIVTVSQVGHVNRLENAPFRHVCTANSQV
jgi:hypothetical protein